MAYEDEDRYADMGAPPAPGAGGTGGAAPPAGAPPGTAADRVDSAARAGGRGGIGAAPDRPTFSFPGLPGFVGPSFVAPTFEQALTEPGYNFRLKAGEDALQRSAAARGVLRSGGTLQDLIKYGQNFGAQEYSNVYNRALQSHDRAYQLAKDKYAPQLARWQTLANAETQAGLAAYNASHRGGGGGGGGGFDPSVLGPPPTPPDYAQMLAASGPVAPAAMMAPMTSPAATPAGYGGYDDRDLYGY